MSMMQAVRSVFRHYAVFKGRARRSEFWKFLLFNFLIGFVGILLSSLMGSSKGSEGGSMFGMGILGLYMLIVFLPSLALTVRRLHDTGRSGWFILISITGVGGIVLLMWFCQEGNLGENRFGPDPKAKEASPVPAAPPVIDAHSAPADAAPVIPLRAPVPAPAAEDKTCPNCGAVLAPSAMFCTSCGCSLSAGSSPAPAAPKISISMGHKSASDSPPEKKPTDEFWQTPTDF